MRGALLAAGGGAAAGAAGPLRDANLTGLACARLAAWQGRNPDVATYQVWCCQGCYVNM